MVDFDALTRANLRRWQEAKLTRKAEAGTIAARLYKAKARYQAVEAKTGVPWWFIACVHERESAQKWDTQLGQGDPLNQVSTHVPKGRGPFSTWEAGAVDALVNCPPKAAQNKDWSLAGALVWWEKYNGMAYANAGRPSPYVWSGTTAYDPPTGPGGKVLVDHGPIEDVYPSGPRKGQRVVDLQMGCVALIMALMAIDPTITFTGAKITPAQAPTPVPQRAPAQSAWGAFFSAILKLIGRK